MKIERRKKCTANIGILAVGHYAYWPQFDGLLAKLNEKRNVFERKVKNHGVNVIGFGMIDRPEQAYAVLPKIKAADLDLLFIDMVTYATSSTFGIIARDIDAPIVLVALQPLAAMDYAKASIFIQLLNDDFCAVPEFTGVAIRMGKKAPEVIVGQLEGDAAADREIGNWCRIAMVLHDLRRARIGQMGHVLESMLDMQTDPTAVTAAFGCHVVQCEIEEVMRHFTALKPQDAAAENKKREILEFFDAPEPVSDPVTEKLTERDLDSAARAAVALERFIDAKRLDGLAYYYEAEEGSETRTLISSFIVGNSLLTAAGFPMCGEFDIKTCLAMLIMDRLDIGGSFAEFHPIDFNRDSILVGHDGPHHIGIADDKPVIRSLKKYHGKPGCGAGVEFKIKEGPLTILSIGVRADGKFKMVIAEGESIAGPVLPTGNTNTHGRFQPDIRTFLKRWVAEGPTHHFALGIGHKAKILKKIGGCLGIEAVIIKKEVKDQ
ncbi:MAG: L-fucose/L-arabinose isomerase family protein [Verrucomicrobia bacterium]|nr:L-fucose/L-arabinose isomerase family protein [Verrucomicrobiota bacterium]MBU1734295.1 L-fucose/L-arabinose isomerase family protein [Verrucomicrobiota bacterium]MBU1857016.1 L-fucose/L-arabinose isomerase family protein [Verrucomicrobiota bacterium]